MSRIRIRKRTKAQFPKPVAGTCSAATSDILRPPFKIFTFLNEEEAKSKEQENQDQEQNKSPVSKARYRYLLSRNFRHIKTSLYHI